MKRFARGFTLIELLVVISIIGMLSSVVLASVASARDKGRIAAGLTFEGHTRSALGDKIIAEYKIDNVCPLVTSGNLTGLQSSWGSSADLIPSINGGLSCLGSYSANTPTGKGGSFNVGGAGAGGIGNYYNNSIIVSSYTEFAVGFWVKVDSNTTINNAPTFQIDGNSGASVAQLNFTENGIDFIFSNNSTYLYNQATIATAGNIYDSKWHHVFVSVKNGKVSTYIDGKFSNASNLTGTISVSVNSLKITLTKNPTSGPYLIDGLTVFSDGI